MTPEAMQHFSQFVLLIQADPNTSREQKAQAFRSAIDGLEEILCNYEDDDDDDLD